MKIALFVKEELQETDIATYIISKISEHNFDIDQDHPDYVLFVGMRSLYKNFSSFTEAMKSLMLVLI